jgi:hypothetical protein
LVTKALRQRLLWALVIAAGLTAAVYHGTGYLIGAIYGGAMKAYRAKHTPAIPKPPGWATDNVYLGRWQGISTAGMAVIGVLTVKPNRIRWGNQANGICDSDYTVDNLPWGRHGTYPDQLVPPSQPTDLIYGVARLTLKPKPCSTGDAVIQLAIPLDGSNNLQVNTYDAQGQLIGSYGSFEPIRN